MKKEKEGHIIIPLTEDELIDLISIIETKIAIQKEFTESIKNAIGRNKVESLVNQDYLTILSKLQEHLGILRKRDDDD